MGPNILFLNPNFLFDGTVVVGESGSEGVLIIIKGDALNWLGHLLFEVYTPPEWHPLARDSSLPQRQDQCWGMGVCKWRERILLPLKVSLLLNFCYLLQADNPGIGFKISAVVRVESAGDLKFQAYCVYWGQVYYLPHIHNAHKHVLCAQFWLGVNWSLCLTFQDPSHCFPKWLNVFSAFQQWLGGGSRVS